MAKFIEWMKRDRWSPYVVGLGIAVLSVVSFFFFHKLLGTSSVFVKLAALFWLVVDPGHLVENAYYRGYTGVWFDWQGALVVGLFIGAFIAGRISKGGGSEEVPELWKRNFGEGRLRRHVGAFVGGMLVLFGARLAGGCTSGHGISGGMQLAVTSWIFLGGLFAVGIPTAMLLYRRRS